MDDAILRFDLPFCLRLRSLLRPELQVLSELLSPLEDDLSDDNDSFQSGEFEVAAVCCCGNEESP